MWGHHGEKHKKKIMDYKNVAPTQFNTHAINMETGAQRGEDMSKVMSFTFKIHSIISQPMFVELFLGFALCWGLWGGGGGSCIIRRKKNPFLASKKLCSNWALQPTSTSPLPEVLALSLATSLWVSRVVSALRTQLKPNKIHLLWSPFQHTKLCVIYSISFYTHYSPPW